MAISNEDAKRMSAASLEVERALIKTLRDYLPTLEANHGLNTQLAMIAVVHGLAHQTAAMAAQSVGKHREWASDLAEKLVHTANVAINEAAKG